MGLRAADYSWSRPAPQALADAGFTIALRYLSYQSGKNLSIAERDALHSVGLAIGLVWETTANRTLGGFDAGRADAIEANAQADVLGFPPDKALFYAVDFDASAGQISGPITAYFHGAVAAGGRPVGGYGSYFVVEALARAGVIEHAWQCAAWSGTGSGSGGSLAGRRLSEHACLFQYPDPLMGGAIDHNDVLMDPAPWAWGPGIQTAAIPPEEDLTMKAIHVEGNDAQWILLPDGNGRLRRCFLAPGEPNVLEWVGVIDGTVDLNPLQAAIFFDRYPESPPVHLHEQVLGLEMRLQATLQQVLAHSGAEVDEAALAEKLAAPVAQAVATLLRSEGGAVGIDPAKIDALIARVTAAGQALAGAPQG